MEEYAYMNGKLERMKAVAIGQPYTDFELATPEGEILRVSDVHQGNVFADRFLGQLVRTLPQGKS